MRSRQYTLDVKSKLICFHTLFISCLRNNNILIKKFIFCLQDFISCLCNKVLGLMKEKSTHHPEKWMSDLAVGSIRLKEGNTFARAVWLHLVDKICVHLSEIVATCDLYSGLDHVQGTEQSWIRRVFVEMMPIVGINPNEAQASSFR